MSEIEGHRGTSQFMVTRVETPDGMVDRIIRKPNSHTKKAPAKLGEKPPKTTEQRKRKAGENKGKVSIVTPSGSRSFVSPDGVRPNLKAHQAVTEGLGFVGDLQDVFFADLDLQEGDPIDTEVTGSVPEVLFRSEIGDAITPQIAEQMSVSGLLDLDLADSEDSF